MTEHHKELIADGWRPVSNEVPDIEARQRALAEYERFKDMGKRRKVVTAQLTLSRNIEEDLIWGCTKTEYWLTPHVYSAKFVVITEAQFDEVNVFLANR